MPELPGRPDLDQLRAALGGDARALAEAKELIAAQYSGRPQLRPILDAVLAAARPVVRLILNQCRANA
jgi:hypothetical protein